MDRVAAENTRIVLLATVGLTVLSVLTLLIMVYQGKDTPDILLGLVTTLIGLLTGSAINLGAKPKVPKAESAADPLAVEAADDSILAVETDAPEPADDPIVDPATI